MKKIEIKESCINYAIIQDLETGRYGLATLCSGQIERIVCPTVLTKNPAGAPFDLWRTQLTVIDWIDNQKALVSGYHGVIVTAPYIEVERNQLHEYAIIKEFPEGLKGLYVPDYNFKTKAEYLRIEQIEEGKIFLGEKDNHKKVLIIPRGERKISAEFDEILPEVNGFFRIRNNTRWSFLDAQTGQLLTKFIFLKASDFEETTELGMAMKWAIVHTPTGRSLLNEYGQFFSIRELIGNLTKLLDN